MKRLLKRIQQKENTLMITIIFGILLLSLGILLIKATPPFATSLIILGSFLLFVSVVAFVFVT